MCSYQDKREIHSCYVGKVSYLLHKPTIWSCQMSRKNIIHFIISDVAYQLENVRKNVQGWVSWSMLNVAVIVQTWTKPRVQQDHTCTRLTRAPACVLIFKLSRSVSTREEHGQSPVAHVSVQRTWAPSHALLVRSGPMSHVTVFLKIHSKYWHLKIGK